MNPSKGLNNLISPTLIDNREASDLMNIEFDEGGVVRKRGGFTTTGGALTNAKGLGVFYTETIRHMVTVNNGTLNYLNSNVWTAYAGSVAFTTSAETTFTQARSLLYIWNGTEGGATCDGTTVTQPGIIPKAKFAIFYQGIHFASGVDGQPNRLYMSTTTDASDFTNAATNLNNATEVPGATVFAGTGAQFVDVAKDDGDKITGLGRFQEKLIVFKEKSIYQLTIDSAGVPTVEPITNSTGCVGHKTVENVENDVYFLSREGVRSMGNEPNFFTAIRTNVLSAKIGPSIDGINATYYYKCNAIYFDNKYILGAPTNTAMVDRDYVFDRRFTAWTVWDTIEPNSMTTFTNSSNQSDLYWLDDTGTQVYKWTPGVYNDNGAGINAWWTSKAQEAENIDITKRFADLRLVFRRLNGVVDLTIYDDEGTSDFSRQIGTPTLSGYGMMPWGMAMLGTSGTTSSSSGATVDTPYSIPINKNSRTLKFRIANDLPNENFVFLGYIIGLYLYSHYKFDSTKKIYS